MKLCNYEISSINFGFFRLDGGAMFGSVPKNIWSKRIPGDEENCIKLATRCLIIRDESRFFLVDVGMGEKWNEKSRKIFAIKNIPESEWGFKAKEVTDIILTHLHFDHAGGISRYKNGIDGETELCFSQARVFLQEDNLKNAKNPNLREKASYLKENFEPLEANGLNLINGETEIAPGVWVVQCNGHSMGQQWIEIREGKKTVLMYPTDLIPTSHHLPIPFNMGYDICAETVLREKEQFLAKALREDAIVVFEHDPDIEAAKVGVDQKGHYCVREQVSL